MAKLLVRVTDKVNTDFYLNCQCTKRGDVIVAQPDGQPWQKEELTNPVWRILQIASLDMITAATFVVPEMPADPLNPSKTLQKRAFKLDVDAIAKLAATFAAYIADDKRTLGTLILKDTPQQITDATKQSAISAATIVANKVLKPAIADPAIIGVQQATVLG